MREPKTIRTLVGTIKGEAKGGGKQEISCYREMINPDATRYSPTKCRELRGGRGVGNVKHVIAKMGVR